jgi:predicted metallo-beta-lactamase superfamily hydrolase
MDKAKDILRKIAVTPIASESFGVRSMCTLVQTPEVTMLLDAGVSLCPYRFNLPPHPIEFQTIAKLRKKIADAADKASIVTISHYHFDHHTPSYEDWVVNWTESYTTANQIYHGKTILLKNPKENINTNQRKRAWIFQKTGGKTAKNIVLADGKTFNFGKTKVKFSPAVTHGSEDNRLGWVIMTTIQHEDEKFLFAPDVQGPMSQRTTDIILSEQPAVAMLGGPPLYLENSKVDTVQINQSLKNMERLVAAVPLILLEHHALRDEGWKGKMGSIYQCAARSRHDIMTAAEYAGHDNIA